MREHSETGKAARDAGAPSRQTSHELQREMKGLPVRSDLQRVPLSDAELPAVVWAESDIGFWSLLGDPRRFEAQGFGPEEVIKRYEQPFPGSWCEGFWKLFEILSASVLVGLDEANAGITASERTGDLLLEPVE